MLHRFLLRPLALLAIASLSFALTGCGGGEPLNENEIRIGEYGSITGEQATFGKTTHEGVLLAVKEINAAGGVNGKTIKLFFEDNASDSQQTRNVVTSLITDKKVVALLGEVASGRSLIGGPIAQKYGIPMISPSSTNPEVTKVGDKIFRVCFIDPDQGYAVAKFASENLKATKAAILFDQKEPYSTGLRDNFRDAFKKMGGTITTEQAYSGGDADVSAVLVTIRDTKPDVIFVPGYYSDVPNIAIQARKLGLNQPLLGADGWETDNLPGKAEGKLEGCYYSNHYAPADKRPESVKFVDAFMKEYKREPSALAALGYDSAMLLFDAMKRAKSLGGKDLAQALVETKDFKGATGTINFNANRDPVKPMVIIKIEGGKESYVTTIDPPKP